MVGGFVEQSIQLGQHDAIQAVGQRPRPSLSTEEQLAGLDGIFGFDVGPAQFGQPRTDRHVFGRTRCRRRGGTTGRLACQLLEETENRFLNHRPRLVDRLAFAGHLFSLGNPRRWSAMMPRCTSAVPPMIVAAREYHHSARAVLSAAPPRPVPAIICSLLISRTRSFTSFSARPNSSLSMLLSAPTDSPAASRRTVVAVRACAATTST